jgi:predicted RNase H-like nuclease (RuvC/YqgF family)
VASQGHKKEIREREETVVDKEKRIYDLRKKNQELEKFKFVLDYKIKELKRQIEPREAEIGKMRQVRGRERPRARGRAQLRARGRSVAGAGAGV